MTKNQKKQRRHNSHAKKNHTADKDNPPASSRVKEFSKRLLHDYVIPMTKTLEHRLQRLERSL